ncbi:hypothetical protein N181_25050 [Sinorhizobium fredii USDA 205]|nr:hypothetical protein [Sinorhizobium fredii]ASY73338.1 hypothetical protein SF83666_b66890 [Sinorhizobium fredii CCBAU 83666]KSV83756.1 hypothetical protein N181_25050 [Sinorhizobium fredii USDA 205]
MKRLLPDFEKAVFMQGGAICSLFQEVGPDAEANVAKAKSMAQLAGTIIDINSRAYLGPRFSSHQ